MIGEKASDMIKNTWMAQRDLDSTKKKKKKNKKRKTKELWSWTFSVIFFLSTTSQILSYNYWVHILDYNLDGVLEFGFFQPGYIYLL